MAIDKKALGKRGVLVGIKRTSISGRPASAESSLKQGIYVISIGVCVVCISRSKMPTGITKGDFLWKILSCKNGKFYGTRTTCARNASGAAQGGRLRAQNGHIGAATPTRWLRGCAYVQFEATPVNCANRNEGRESRGTPSHGLRR